MELRHGLPAHQLAAALIQAGYSMREVAMASGWMNAGKRDEILQNCEDLLEDWNHHGDSYAVRQIRKGGRLPFPSDEQIAANRKR